MKLLGIAPDEVAGTFGNTLVADTPENLRRLRDAFAAVGSGKETGGVVLELRRNDSGVPLWIQWWSKPARSGKFTRTVLVDITDSSSSCFSRFPPCVALRRLEFASGQSQTR
jgi:formate hydrogenlyase transcriptional activator